MELRGAPSEPPPPRLDSSISKQDDELMRWASDRQQTLSRTVRGMMLYGDALRVLARLEGAAEEEVEALVHAKFEFVVTCQIYGKLRASPGPRPRVPRTATRALHGSQGRGAGPPARPADGARLVQRGGCGGARGRLSVPRALLLLLMTQPRLARRCDASPARLHGGKDGHIPWTELCCRREGD